MKSRKSMLAYAPYKKSDPDLCVYAHMHIRGMLMAFYLYLLLWVSQKQLNFRRDLNLCCQPVSQELIMPLARAGQLKNNYYLQHIRWWLRLNERSLIYTGFFYFLMRNWANKWRRINLTGPSLAFDIFCTILF